MTFEELIDRAARQGFRALACAPRAGGLFEASVESEHRGSYNVSVNDTPLSAIAGLFLLPGETVWFTHPKGPPVINMDDLI